MCSEGCLLIFLQEREQRRKEREVTLAQKDKDKEIEVIKVSLSCHYSPEYTLLLLFMLDSLFGR